MSHAGREQRWTKNRCRRRKGWGISARRLISLWSKLYLPLIIPIYGNETKESPLSANRFTACGSKFTDIMCHVGREQRWTKNWCRSRKGRGISARRLISLSLPLKMTPAGQLEIWLDEVRARGSSRNLDALQIAKIRTRADKTCRRFGIEFHVCTILVTGIALTLRLNIYLYLGPSPKSSEDDGNIR